MNKAVIAVVMLITGTIGALTGAPSAYAATENDNAIQQSDGLLRKGGCDNIDIRNTYIGYIQNSTKAGKDTFVAEMNSTLATGKGWALVEHENWSGFNYYVYAIQDSDTQSNAYFDNKSLKAWNMRLAFIQMNDACQAEVVQFTNSLNNWTLSADPTIQYTKQVFVNMDITYPDGYAGEQPATGINNEELVTPEFTLGFDPTKMIMTLKEKNRHSTVGSEYQNEWIARHFMNTEWDLTQEQLTDLEPEEFEQIDYKVLDKDLVHEVKIPSFGVYEFEVFWIKLNSHDYDGDPDNDATPDYEFYTSLEDVEGIDYHKRTVRVKLENSVFMADSSELECDVAGNCNLVPEKFDIMAGCVDSAFPYLHVDTCIGNIMKVASTLVLGKIEFPTFTFRPQCRTLGTMGDWLNLQGENRTVCPMISENVRNVVTPFVSFMLGIVTFGILHKRAIGEI